MVFNPFRRTRPSVVKPFNPQKPVNSFDKDNSTTSDNDAPSIASEDTLFYQSEKEFEIRQKIDIIEDHLNTEQHNPDVIKFFLGTLNSEMKNLRVHSNDTFYKSLSGSLQNLKIKLENKLEKDTSQTQSNEFKRNNQPNPYAQGLLRDDGTPCEFPPDEPRILKPDTPTKYLTKKTVTRSASAPELGRMSADNQQAYNASPRPSSTSLDGKPKPPTLTRTLSDFIGLTKPKLTLQQMVNSKMEEFIRELEKIKEQEANLVRHFKEPDTDNIRIDAQRSKSMPVFQPTTGKSFVDLIEKERRSSRDIKRVIEREQNPIHPNYIEEQRQNNNDHSVV